MDDNLNTQKELHSANIMQFLCNSGNKYYSLIIPAIALAFSQNIHSLKITITIFYGIIAILQLVPGVLVRKIGFKAAMNAYMMCFLLGTVIGYFYNGNLIWLIISRSLQGIGISVMPFFSKIIIFQLPKSLAKKAFIQRTLISSFAAPILIAILGVLIEISSWRASYIAIGVIYFITLFWGMKYAKDIEIKDIIPAGKQLKQTYLILKNKKIMLLMMSFNFMGSITVIIMTVYSFIFHLDYHINISIVGCAPLIFAVCSLLSTVAAKKQNKTSITDKSMSVASLAIIQIITIVMLIIAYLGLQSAITYIAGFSLLYFYCQINYIYLSAQVNNDLKGLHKNIEFNIAYYLTNNILPFILVLIWALTENNHLSIPIIMVSLSTLSCMFLFIYFRAVAKQSLQPVP